MAHIRKSSVGFTWLEGLDSLVWPSTPISTKHIHSGFTNSLLPPIPKVLLELWFITLFPSPLQGCCYSLGGKGSNMEVKLELRYHSHHSFLVLLHSMCYYLCTLWKLLRIFYSLRWMICLFFSKSTNWISKHTKAKYSKKKVHEKETGRQEKTWNEKFASFMFTYSVLTPHNHILFFIML